MESAVLSCEGECALSRRKEKFVSLKIKKMCLAGSLVAGAVVLAPVALAASTLSVGGTTSPPGDVPVTMSVNAPGMSFLTDFGVPMTCTASAASGYVKRGSSVTSGTKIGAITNLAYTGCTMAGAYPVIVKKNNNSGSPAEWPIHVVGNPAKGQTMLAIEIRTVDLKMHSTIPAVPSVSNRWPLYLKAEGTLPGTFNQTTQQVIINTAPSYPLTVTAYDGVSESAPVALPASGPGTYGGNIYTDDRFAVTGSMNTYTPGVGGIHF